MAIVQTEAIVLRSHRLGETSLIVSLFTREFGLLRCVAKGARGPKSRFGASLEPGVRVSAVVYRKLSRDLQLLSKTDILEALPALWDDPDRFAAATQVLEFLERAAYGEAGDPELLDLSFETLRAMAQAPTPCLELLVRGFEIKACEKLGYAPELTACLECRAPLGQGGLFHPVRGGLLCESCGGGHGSFRLSERARRTMVALSVQPASALSGWAAERYPGVEVAKAVERFLMAHLERFEGLRASRVAEAMGHYRA
jgi:DNA repair protein RecO (recombination protein O)